ncbi:MAG: hypothetical protein FWF91_06625 [Coriobacteriia bacterium]|nr:hypothetical protein [Coriobacteriia bacterium]
MHSALEPQPKPRAGLAAVAIIVLIVLSLLWVFSSVGAWNRVENEGAGTIAQQTNPMVMSQAPASQAPAGQAPVGQAPADTRKGMPAFPDTCPVRLPAGCTGLVHSQGSTSESWSAYSVLECREVAQELLLALRDDGFELVKAGFLDISGYAWGCTVKAPDNSSFVITLIPQRIGMPSGEDNRLSITIVHIVPPDLEDVGEVAGGWR